MKKILLTLTLCLGLGTVASAQNKNAKVNIQVNGKCKMCKKRIEKASYKINGVKLASWNNKKQNLSLIIDENKTSTIEIQKKIASLGHHTKLNDVVIKATKEQYNNLHECCKY